MTVDEHVMNRYSISNFVPGSFHKLFDNNQSCFHNPTDILLQNKRHQFPFNSFPMAMFNTDRAGFNNSNLWKSGGGLPYFPLQQHYPHMKYFPLPPPGSMEILNNYLQGPSTDMIKYVEKIREEEIATKMKDNPEAKLCEEDLWKRFNGLTTEMVITKSGRRMFPAFKVQLSGLDPKSKYVLALEMMPCDDNRFKFHNGKWTLAGKADPESNRLHYLHCESPSTGESWMQKAVWFNKVKLTNNPTDKDIQHLVLNSMHKYVIRLHIFRVDDTNKVRFCLYPEVFVFNTTEFIAVTAYQNDKITQLKIDNNPFAKGFRDNGSGRREKKRLKYQQTITSTSPDSPVEIDEEAGGKRDEAIKLPIESYSSSKSTTFLNIIVNKEKFPEVGSNSPPSTVSSQDIDGHNYFSKPAKNQQNNTIDLKRKYNSSTPEPALSVKRRGITTNVDRRSNTVKYHSDDVNPSLRGPHTVHYTPRRLCPSNLSFLDNVVNHSVERPVSSLKTSCNIWPGLKMEPLQMMSKVCRMMSQYKGNHISNICNDNCVKSFDNIWSRNSFLDSAEKTTFLPQTGFCPKGQNGDIYDNNHSQVQPAKISDKRSSTFNISSLL